MFRTTSSLMAEDVTVRCRVRKLSSNSVTGDGTVKIVNNNVDNLASPTIFEMTCTMRNWDTTSTGSNFYGRSSSNRSGTAGSTYQQHQKSSSRNMMLQNDFSMSNPELRMNTDTNESCTTTGNSRIFHSDSAIDITQAAADAKAYHGSGPELLFTPTYDVSPSKSTRIYSSRRISPIALQPYSIPVEEILLVTYDIANNCDHNASRNTKILITTLSLGHYDVDYITSNGHDIVLAFLQASLPQDRIVREETKDGSPLKSGTQSPNGMKNQSRNKYRMKSSTSTNNPTGSGHDDDEIPNVQSTNSSVNSSCFDIDALQAKHLAGRAEAETWYEKLHRRYGHVVSNVLEQFDTCCNNNTISTTQQKPSYPDGTVAERTVIKERGSPLFESTTTGSTATITNARPQKSSVTTTGTPERSATTKAITACLYGELEIDDNATDVSLRDGSPPSISRRRQQQSTKSFHLPPKQHEKNIHPSSDGVESALQQQRHCPYQQHPNIKEQRIQIAHMPSGLSVEPEQYDVESVR